MLASDLAGKLGGRLLGLDLELNSIRSLQKADEFDLAVFLRPQDVFAARSTGAGCVLVGVDSAADHTDTLPCSLIVVNDVFEGFAQVMDLFSPKEKGDDEAPKHLLGKNMGHLSSEAIKLMPRAWSKNAKLGSTTIIHPFSYVDDRAIIGEGCEVGPGARIIGQVKIGDRVIIGANSVIGSCGFVFAPSQNSRARRVSGSKGVIIGDDVEIGASCCVDRGILEDTSIEAGVKIDNQVQIAHDVVIGENSIICGQSGVAGYAKIGPRCSLGGAGRNRSPCGFRL